jgi:type VI protein secretion system component Hcp
MTFDIKKKWRWLGVLGAVFVPAIVTAAVTVPFTFSPGTPIRASEVNANFQTLQAALDGGVVVPQAAIGTLSLAGITETIPIRSFGHNLRVVVDGSSGGSTGRAVVDDVEVSFALGNPSPQLNRTLNQGQHLQTANLAIGNLLINLQDVILTGLLVDGTVDGVPLQKLKVAFSAIEWTWQPTGQPARTVSFNRAQNTGSGSSDTSVQYAFFGQGVTPDSAFIGITGYTSDQGCTSTGSSGAGGCARVTHSPFTVTKTAIGAHLLDDLSAVTSGRHHQTADIQWLRAGTGGAAVVQHRTELEDFIVTEVKISTAPDGNLTESVGMSYNRIRWTVGSSVSGWNLAQNAPF